MARMCAAVDRAAAEAADAGDHVFEVIADWVNLSGFTATGATGLGKAGIYLNNADYCDICRNNVSENYYGIRLSYSSNNNTLQNNAANSNNHIGICLSYSSNNNTLSSNNALNNDYGIWLYSSNNSMLQNNVANSNNYGGIFLHYSNNNTLANNTVSNNGYGIHLSYSSNNTLTNNAANSNDYGIDMDSSSNNTHTNNIINSNNYYGVYLYSSSNYNTLTNNTVDSNNYGIVLIYSSDYNTIYHNNLTNTIENAYDTSTNQWDNNAEGNYYSDYIGTDNNIDGIGDDPHPIPPSGTSVGRYPLMHPWTGDTPLKGNLNHDGIITPADAAIALRLAAGGSASCDAATLDAADVIRDGCVTSLDALMILQAAAGAITL